MKPKLHVVTSNVELERARGERPLMCLLCAASFRKDDLAGYDRHVAACAKTEAADRAEMLGPKGNPLLRDVGDPELREFFRQHRKAIMRGDIRP